MTTPDGPTGPGGPVPDEVVGVTPVRRQEPRNDGSRTARSLGGAAMALALVTAAALIGLGSWAGLRISALTERVEAVEEQADGNADDITSLISAVQSLAGPSSSVELPEGYLPSFDPTLANDPAIGMVLGPLSVTSYPDGTSEIVDPSDGLPRVWLVWAHWCPHCQAELPALAEVYPQIADSSVGLVTISTNQDPSRGNPQDEYLASSDFPFTVFIDSNDAAAAQMGVASFPSWMITDGDGSVVSRWSGEIGADTMVQLFSDLEEYFSETS
jgi:cytochrome c biogenesis protein CcmG, thiol:disulfide interchange protein DsbE